MSEPKASLRERFADLRVSLEGDENEQAAQLDAICEAMAENDRLREAYEAEHDMEGGF